MKEARSLEWQRLYQKTVSERDPERLPEGIARAEAAIYLRIKQIPPGKMDEAERQAPIDFVPPPSRFLFKPDLIWSLPD